MNISSCESPLIVPNRYTGEMQVVPCRRCNTCTTRHGFSWIQRIEQESACWKYRIFVTLTYSEEFVPCLYRSYVDYFAEDNDFIVWRGHRTSSCLMASELAALDKDSLDYLNKIDRLRVLNYEDVQVFLKRLRSKSDYLNYGKFRFFCCGEYGETTLRPHYHLVLFTNSYDFYSDCERLCCEAWTARNSKGVKVQLGRIDCSLVVQSVASYVAGYVNGFSHLPQVLALPKIRPFSQASRRPPLGSLLQSSEQIRKIFDKGLVQMSQWTKKGLVALPLPSYVRDRLFPTISRYSQVPSCYRVSLYRIADRFTVEESDGKREIISKLKNYIYSISSDRFESLYAYSISDGLYNDDVLYRWYRISLRVLTQAAAFNVTIEQYVAQIDKYLQNVSFFKLRQQYEFQQNYVRQGSSASDLDFMYFMDMEDSYLRGEHNRSLLDVSEYQNMVFRSRSFYRRSTKTKKKNDYLAAHPDKCRFVYH